MDFCLNELFSEEIIKSLLPILHSKNDCKKIGSSIMIEGINEDLVQKIGNELDLTFVAIRKEDGNLCMADNSEIIPAYRETFSIRDLLNYINAVFYSSTFRNNFKQFREHEFIPIPLPKKSVSFWKKVARGEQLQNFTY